MTGRRGPKPLSAEHDHRWQPTGTTRTISGITFTVDACTRGRCKITRLRRVDQLPLPPKPRRA